MMSRQCWQWVMWLRSLFLHFFFQAEAGIRDLVRSRGLGDVYKRQVWDWEAEGNAPPQPGAFWVVLNGRGEPLCIVETLSLIHI